MKKILTPKEKKELDYERQHFSPGKNDKAFRRQWPIKKAKVQRAFRRIVNESLRRVNETGVEESEWQATSKRRKSVTKWTIMNLRQRVQLKKENRAGMVNARKHRQSKI
jgi:hypothetical protein